MKCIILFLSILLIHASAFNINSNLLSGRSACLSGVSSSHQSPTQLNLLGGLFGEKKNTDPTVPKRMFEIECTNMKPGGLRFALGLFLIGQQGTPVKGSWKANQADDGVLDMYYVDNTAMFSVVMSETSLSVDRYGLEPSLQYQLQESLVLHRLLDEIETLALGGEEEVENENRLLVFAKPEAAVSEARKKLPARAED